MSTHETRRTGALDALCIAGGSGVLALALAALPFAGIHDVLLGGTALVSAAHLGVTALRVARVRTASVGGRSAGPLLVVGAFAAALVGAALVGAHGHAAFDALFVVLAVVLPAHVALQSARSATVLALRNGASLIEPRAIVAAACGALASSTALFTGPREVLAWRGAVSLGVGTAVWAALCACALALALLAVRPGRPKPWASVAALALPPLVAGAPLALGAALPGDWVLTGPPALLHALQLIAFALVLERAAARREARAFDPVAYVGIAAGIGAAVVIDVPLLTARITAADPSTLLLAAAGTTALAQALLDAWAFRVPALDAPHVAGPVVPHGRERVSNARAAVVALPVGLAVALAALVPVHAALIDRGEPALSLARTLFPADARVAVADAAAAIARDDVAGATLALDQAGANLSADVVRLRVRLCVAARTDAAFAADQAPLDLHMCFAAVPDALRLDVEVAAARIDAALDLGARSAALADARAVAQAHPEDPHAQALLGAALAAADAADARAVLETALADVALTSGAEPAVLDAVQGRAACALGRIYRIAGVRAESRRLLEAAGRTATTLALPDVAVAAFTELARLEDAGGDARASLTALRVALGAGAYATDQVPVAEAWLALLELLGRSAASPTDRYTCALAAADALRGAAARHEARAVVAADVDAALARTAAVVTPDERVRVEQDLDAAARAVLTLGYPAPPGLVDEAVPDKNPSP